jgi:MFS family permease
MLTVCVAARVRCPARVSTGVSALSTLAFVIFVPSHPNTNSSRHSTDKAEQQPLLQQQQQPRKQQQQQQQPRKQQRPQPSPARGAWWATAAQFVRDVRSMGVDFYRTLAVIAMYGLGHINESLLEARAIEVGFGKAEATLVVALLCFSVFLCAYPLGRLDDRHGHAVTFGLGMASLVAGNLVLLLSTAWPPAVFVACGFWVVHWAVVQGPMLSAVVGMAPPHLKGSAFGIFYTMMAVVAVVANTMFGSVWHAHSATAAFALSACIIGVTMLLTPLLLPASAKRGRARAAAVVAADRGGSALGGGLKPAPA